MTPTAEVAESGRVTYYFCSAYCRAEFEREPIRY